MLIVNCLQVWLLDLILFYMHVGEDEVGEPWTTPASWFQLFGFAVLLLGTVIYAQVSVGVLLPGFWVMLYGVDAF